MIGRRTAICALLVLSWAGPASAHDYKLGSLEIATPWTRATPATAKSGGGFMTISNKGTTPDRLISARSPASLKVEIHEMKMDGNVMHMRAVPALDLPKGQAVQLKPGSYHLMLMDLKQPLAKDTTVPITLKVELANKRVVEQKVEAKVRDLTAGNMPAMNHDHGGEHKQ